MKSDNDLLVRFTDRLAKSDLIPEAARTVVGYSGGADSTCLIDLLNRLGRSIVAAHLHHGQRSEADDEFERCRRYCAGLSVPFVSGRVDVPGLAQELKIGIEEAGREARYAFLREVAQSQGCELIATAHTRTDHVETVLLNLARGSGLAGIAGIPERRDEIVRPLLAFTRDETRAHCQGHGLWFHDDPANEDVAFARSRVRRNILPELRLINPEVESAISRLAATAHAEDECLDGAASASLERAELPLNGELRFLSEHAEMSFDRNVLAHAPEALLRRAIRLAVEALGARLDHRQTEVAAIGVFAGSKGSVTADEGKVVLEWDSETVDVRTILPTRPFRFPLTVPGETVSDDFGWKFVAFSGPMPARTAGRQSLEVAVSCASTLGSLYFRSMEPADRIRPYGFNGSRKVADLCAEAGLTPMARLRLPIVCDNLGPLWVPGVCIDDRTRSVKDSSSAIIARFGPVT